MLEVSKGLILPRRSFIKGTGITIASLFVAPQIIRADSLMQINTLQNRLVVGFRPRRDTDTTLGMSMLNAAAFIDKEKYEAWKEACAYNEYSLVRRAEVTLDQYLDTPERARITKQVIRHRLEEAVISYRLRRGLIT